jgi:hypothetical protein
MPESTALPGVLLRYGEVAARIQASDHGGAAHKAEHLWQCDHLLELTFPTLDAIPRSIAAALLDEWSGSLVELVEIAHQLA